ncbi:fimbrial adhesin EcpD [Serratia sp. D1N4]
MKAKLWLIAALCGLWWFCGAANAVTVENRAAAAPMTFVFVENNNDNNFFVTPAAGLDPRLTGANQWTGLKSGSSGTHYQQSLGYISSGYNDGLLSAVPNYYFDMWLENGPVANPLLGLRCINWYTGCNLDTSLILPALTDSKGFYGVRVPYPNAGMWMQGMMSPSFYSYLQQMAPGASFSMQVNGCQTSIPYDATKGGRCKDQTSGLWNARTVTHKKGAHLRFINTDAVSEVFINSNGIPTLGEGNADCKTQTIGSGLYRRDGVMCKMVTYTLQTDGSVSNTSINVFPSINNVPLGAAMTALPLNGIYDLQYSLDGNTWRLNYNNNLGYVFDQLKNSHAIYVFFSSNFFQQMVKLGMSDSGMQDLINFRFYNSTSPESGWYEFSASTQLIIKPRDFGISIISDDFDYQPQREGYVGPTEPPLEFGYVVTTSGKTAADQVQIMATGPTQTINGHNYCIFSSADGATRVPFPAILSITTSSGAQQAYAAGCDSQWHDMTNALWNSTPWNDISGDVGILNKTKVKFSIPMNDRISLKAVDGSGWYGDVSASGEIHVKATWRNIN